DLRSLAQSVECAPKVAPPLIPLVESVVATATRSADALERVAAGIGSGDFDALFNELKLQSRTLESDVATAPRRLRSGNHVASLYVTNAVAGCHDSLRLFADVVAAFSSRIVAVIAPAGCGKTQLAAQLTANTD